MLKIKAYKKYIFLLNNNVLGNNNLPKLKILFINISNVQKEKQIETAILCNLILFK